MGQRERIEWAMDRVEAAYQAGEMDYDEYHQEMSELSRELREVEAAEEFAEEFAEEIRRPNHKRTP